MTHKKLIFTVFRLFFFYRIYYWYDERGKKTKCTAPQYIDLVMTFVQKLVTDEEIFPTKYGVCFNYCPLAAIIENYTI